MTTDRCNKANEIENPADKKNILIKKLSDSTALGRSVGRPSKFNSQMEEKLCDLISQGHSVNKAAETLNINTTTVYKHLRENDEFKNNYEIARQERTDKIFETIIDLEEKAICKEIEPQLFRAIMDERKWFLARMNPKKYGETSKIDTTQEVDISAELSARMDKFNIKDGEDERG